MTRLTPFAAVMTILVAAAPALASPCGDAITSLDAKVKDQAKTAISASTSGKAAAGEREGQGQEGGSAAATPAAPPEKSAQAGEGGDRAMQAKVALDEARTADAKGDRAACEAAIERVRGQLERAP